eukprot:4771010-Karenia_brevis.AAC.1
MGKTPRGQKGAASKKKSRSNRGSRRSEGARQRRLLGWSGFETEEGTEDGDLCPSSGEEFDREVDLQRAVNKRVSNNRRNTRKEPIASRLLRIAEGYSDQSSGEELLTAVKRASAKARAQRIHARAVQWERDLFQPSRDG